MSKKVFGVDIEGAYDRYQKSKKIKKKEIVIMNPSIPNGTRSFVDTTINKGDYEAAKKIIEPLDEEYYSLLDYYKDKYLLLTNNRITYFNLSGDEADWLEEYPSDLEKLTEIRELNLNDNKIEDITPITKLPKLTVLHVADNPLNKKSKQVLEQMEEKGLIVHYQKYD